MPSSNLRTDSGRGTEMNSANAAAVLDIPVRHRAASFGPGGAGRANPCASDRDHPFALREVARKERVDQGVGAPPVEDEIGAQVPFAPEADALQNALRRRVVRDDER